MKNTNITILLGAFFGTVLILGDVFSWFRIQEMFHFKSFHMYGTLGSAIFVGILLRWKKIRSVNGQPIVPKEKTIRPFGNVVGGFLFGAGWALTGACTAPIYILIGVQWQIGLIALLGAILGTYLYSLLIQKLPV
jgi:uncharacterized protein